MNAYLTETDAGSAADLENIRFGRFDPALFPASTFLDFDEGVQRSNNHERLVEKSTNAEASNTRSVVPAPKTEGRPNAGTKTARPVTVHQDNRKIQVSGQRKEQRTR